MKRVATSLAALALVLSMGGIAGARPAESYAGLWDGDTSQDKLVAFRVNDAGKLTKFRMKFDIRGNSCVLHTTALWTGSRLIRNDHFRIHIDDLDGAATFVGDFVRRNKAEGTFKATSNIISGCAGRTHGTWVATR